MKNNILEKIKNLPQPDFIVYVPMSKKSRKRRGYNQTELLAHALSEITGIPAEDGIIVKIKETREQKGLSRKERAENLKGCFKAESKDKIKGRRILIVDDVISTGGSLHAMEALVAMAGGTVTGKVAVLAEGEAQSRSDIRFLAPLPVFNADGTVKG